MHTINLAPRAAAALLALSMSIIGLGAAATISVATAGDAAAAAFVSQGADKQVTTKSKLPVVNTKTVPAKGR